MKLLKTKIWPMTQNQSFIAAALFVVVLFISLLLSAVGDDLLCWINKNSGLAAWVQAIGALAIVWATYQLHYETKRKLDLEVKDRKHIERTKAKFFLVEMSDYFLKIDVFVFHIDSKIKLCEKEYVEYKSVEFFRGMFSQIEALDVVDKKLTELLASNSVPDICFENIYQIALISRRIIKSFSAMTGQADVYNTLALIGDIHKIKIDPIEKSNAEFLEAYIEPWVRGITNLKNELAEEKLSLSKILSK